MPKSRTNETEGSRQKRLEKQRLLYKAKRSTETMEERRIRLERAKRKRQTESKEKRRRRLDRQIKYRKRIKASKCKKDNVPHIQNEINRSSSMESNNNNEQETQDEMNNDGNKDTTMQKIKEFHSSLENLTTVVVCCTCQEIILSNSKLINSSQHNECNRCSRDQCSPKLYSVHNSMIPDEIPQCLQNLSQVEEMLISKVLPVMSIYRLPHGQFGYSGHVLNLPQDITQFVTSLPRNPNNIDVIIVRKEDSTKTHKDFRVRRFMVLNALHYLVCNNVYYRDVTINQNTLALLPEDGELKGVRTMIVKASEETNIDPKSENEDPYTANLSSTFLPMSVTGFTEQEAIHNSVNESHIINWPPTVGQPINEFTTEGYITCAFPTLFPTGIADYLAPRLRKVGLADYFKHMMLLHDRRFAQHPRFRYFALNTIMRHRALDTGRIFIRQNPHEQQLTVEELRAMIQHSDAFTNKVLHFGNNIRGTRQFWFKQKKRLIAMVDTLGLPTVFFTHSAADLQWPELAHFLGVENPNCSIDRSKAIINNPCLADWFFYHRVSKFMDIFYKKILKAKDYWLRFEYQHRGSPHIHGVAWLEDAPDVSTIMSSTNPTLQEELIKYINNTVTTINPAIQNDGSNISDAPPPITCPHVCNKRYCDIDNYEQDLCDLIATCQRHTRCSAAYCLKTTKGIQQCRFGFPKQLETQTFINMDEQDNNELSLVTARNDAFINSYNPLQLSAWRANVDMQYCVSRKKVIEYIAKYATKCEPRSCAMRDVYKNIMRDLKEDDSVLKVVQKLLINSVGDRDFSAQETCHLLLQLPLIKSTRDYTILSLDGSREMNAELGDNNSKATIPSILDHYIQRPTTEYFENMTLLHFSQNYSMPSELGATPKKHKMRIVSVRPFCSPDPNGHKYEQYCKQKLMLYKPFRQIDQIKGMFSTFTAAYANYLQSGNVPPSLDEDIRRLNEQQNEIDEEENSIENISANLHGASDDWLAICNRTSVFPNDFTCDIHNWDSGGYLNIDEFATFITRNRQSGQERTFSNNVDPSKLHGKQLIAYKIIEQHKTTNNNKPLRMIISGTAGTGKSYLINCLRQFLGNDIRIAAPTGVAAYNVDGTTLHSLLNLPMKNEFKDLEGDKLSKIQQSLSNMKYLVIDEISMVGRRMFSYIDRRLRQIFPHHSNEVFGGCSCLLFGDFGQLPPVMDLPLYTTNTSSPISDNGSNAYHLFDNAIVLEQIVRQSGQDLNQIQFRTILHHLRNGECTENDWLNLMTRTPAHVSDSDSFNNALHLYPTLEAVNQYNEFKLYTSNHPVAVIKALHSGDKAARASSDEAGGLEPIICLTKDCRVMLTANLWVEMGLVNGAIGTVHSICYKENQAPPSLPVAVTVLFDNYTGPTLPDNTVPITPLRRSWSSSSYHNCSRLQLPLKLAWAVTIHKSQGLTLNNVVVDIGKKEFCVGLTFVAISRIRRLSNLLINPPFPFQRLRSIANSSRIAERKQEEQRLHSLQAITIAKYYNEDITSST